MKIQNLFLSLPQPQVNQIINIIDNNQKYPFVIEDGDFETIFDDIIIGASISICDDPNIDFNSWPDLIRQITHLDVEKDQNGGCSWEVFSDDLNLTQTEGFEVEFTEEFFNYDNISLSKGAFDRSIFIIKVLKGNGQGGWELVDSCSMIKNQKDLKIYDTITDQEITQISQEYILERALIPKIAKNQPNTQIKHDYKIRVFAPSLQNHLGKISLVSIALPEKDYTYDSSFKLLIEHKEQIDTFDPETGEKWSPYSEEILTNVNYCEIISPHINYNSDRFNSNLKMYSKTNEQGLEEFFFDELVVRALYSLKYRNISHSQVATEAKCSTPEERHLFASKKKKINPPKNQKPTITSSKGFPLCPPFAPSLSNSSNPYQVPSSFKYLSLKSETDVSIKEEIMEFTTSNFLTQLLNGFYITYLEFDQDNDQYRFIEKLTLVSPNS